VLRGKPLVYLGAYQRDDEADAEAPAYNGQHLRGVKKEPPNRKPAEKQH
jgi:hypothetical protein